LRFLLQTMDTRREQRRRIAIALLLGHVCLCVSAVDVARAKERPHHRRELGAQWTSPDVGDDRGASGRIGAVVLQKFVAGLPLDLGHGRHSLRSDATTRGRAVNGAELSRIRGAAGQRVLHPKKRRRGPWHYLSRVITSLIQKVDDTPEGQRVWREGAKWVNCRAAVLRRADDVAAAQTVPRAPRAVHRSGTRARRRRRAGGARKTRAPSGDSDGPASSCSPSSAGGAR
jgi:hypothetical protein